MTGAEGGGALQDASHQLVMITGDTPLTACHAAKQVHIVDRPVLILDSYRFASPICLQTSFSALPCIILLGPQLPFSQCTPANLTAACHIGPIRQMGLLTPLGGPFGCVHEWHELYLKTMKLYS